MFAKVARLDLLDGDHAKLSADRLAAHLAAHAPGVQSAPPRALNLAQATERGAVHTPGELRALTDLAHDAGLKVHSSRVPLLIEGVCWKGNAIPSLTRLGPNGKPFSGDPPAACRDAITV